MNSIFTRRSVRTYTGEKIPPEKIEKILRAGMQAPSARNKQPWEFIVLTDSEKIVDASNFSPYGKSAASADAIIVVLANMKDTDNDTRWFPQDLGACTQNILLQTEEEELGAFWIGIYPNEDRMQPVVDYFNLPEHLIPYSLVSIGYPKQKNTFIDRYVKEKIHWNKY